MLTTERLVRSTVTSFVTKVLSFLYICVNLAFADFGKIHPLYLYGFQITWKRLGAFVRVFYRLSIRHCALQVDRTYAPSLVQPLRLRPTRLLMIFRWCPYCLKLRVILGTLRYTRIRLIGRSALIEEVGDHVTLKRSHYLG